MGTVSSVGQKRMSFIGVCVCVCERDNAQIGHVTSQLWEEIIEKKPSVCTAERWEANGNEHIQTLPSFVGTFLRRRSKRAEGSFWFSKQKLFFGASTRPLFRRNFKPWFSFRHLIASFFFVACSYARALDGTKQNVINLLNDRVQAREGGVVDREWSSGRLWIMIAVVVIYI